MHTCQVIIDLDIMKKKEKMMDESAIILPDGMKSIIAFSADSIRELDKKVYTVLESDGSFDLESVLSYYSYIPDFVHNYYRARYFFSVNDYGNASKFMDRVLRSIESNERGENVANRMIRSKKCVKTPKTRWKKCDETMKSHWKKCAAITNLFDKSL